MADVAAHLRRVRLQPAEEDHSAPTSTIFASPGPGRCPTARTNQRRSCTTACCSFTATATRSRRSMPRPVTCSGSIRAACRPAWRRASSAASRSTARRIYVPTSDAHVVALDVKTGKVVWDQAVADPKTGYRMTGGPLVARGKVMVGTTGRAEGGNYIAALDAETGKEAWRFYTIARPDEPGGKSWNGLPLEKRNGGSVWIPGSYDPVQNLAFFAPGNTYDTGPLRNLVNEPGVTNDALVSRLDARPGSRHRQARLALPTSDERPVGSRLGVRTAGDAAAGQRRHAERRGDRRQADDLRHRRRGNRQVPVVDRPRAAEHRHVDRPEDRREDPPIPTCARRRHRPR